MFVPFHVPLVIVPTDVRLDPVTVLLRVIPVSVPAAAVTVPLPPRLIAVPFTVTELLASCVFEMVPLNADVGMVVDAVTAEVPFPIKYPVSVVAPVPPDATGRVPVVSALELDA